MCTVSVLHIKQKSVGILATPLTCGAMTVNRKKHNLLLFCYRSTADLMCTCFSSLKRNKSFKEKLEAAIKSFFWPWFFLLISHNKLIAMLTGRQVLTCHTDTSIATEHVLCHSFFFSSGFIKVWRAVLPQISVQYSEECLERCNHIYYAELVACDSVACECNCKQGQVN